MKNGKHFVFLAAALCAVLSACAGSPPPPPPVPAQSAPKSDELDAAIRETSDYLNKQLAKGNKLMILNVQSDFPALSEYIIDELIANTVNDRVFSVVDRQQLNTIRAELDFQMSGEVDDATAQSLGRMAGAQIIISGAVSRVGDLYRLRVRALSVQSAQIEGQFNKNIPEGPTVTALVNSKATGYGGTTTASGAGNRTPAPAAAPAPAQAPQPPTPAPVPAPVAPAAPSPAPTVTYKIGDKGPAGGLIFYDKGNNSGGWQYLEAAPHDIDRKLVAVSEYIGSFKSLMERAVGKGKTNTQIIMREANSKGGGFGWAAQACDSLVVNGFDDWFLPSRDELHFMYGNLSLQGLGNFSGDWYWSSTFNEGDNGNWRTTWMAENFRTGEQVYRYADQSYSVRACRQF